MISINFLSLAIDITRNISPMYNLFLSCVKGLESVCAKELKHLGISDTNETVGGVLFEGDLNDIYRVNLWSRTGMRLLVKLEQFSISTQQDLYDNVHKYNWIDILTPQMTFAVDSFVTNSELNHSHYASLRVKDAIVDSIRERKGRRPSVDVSNPDVKINLYLKDNIATIYLDSSGIPLHKRGYRRKMHKASLNESLSAGIIFLSDWNSSEQQFYDPMCGSGTFCIEAALLATNTAPGLFRKSFGFQHWIGFDEKLWNDLVEKANTSKLNECIDIYGSDVSLASIAMAKHNSSVAGVDNQVNWKVRNFSRFDPKTNNGLIITNPPYGERIGEETDLVELYKLIGDTFKQKCSGFNASVFTGNLELAKNIGLKTTARIPLKNGNIDCRLLKYEMYVGSKKHRSE
ncbi:MAG: N-6 DNA methylase [Candidatus Marinimicrobia bacterium]|nr:N-6 DNA methylase [Candidatus Neomarinimicrobiota bacterium]MBL7109695.1 N-6 DNA methylase [Candidatus Neomarinimicrobiota bacterium]